MSSVRLFILGSLAQRGPMHGHALLLLAEEEHIDLWTDFAPSAVYGAIKRLASEGLITAVRVEKQGNYPQRQVYGISEAGEVALHALRQEGLTEIVIKPDPFDLALTRLDSDRLSELQGVIDERLGRLRARLEATEKHIEEATKYLTLSEIWTTRHLLARWRAEIHWHEQLVAAVPDIIADEETRKDLK